MIYFSSNKARTDTKTKWFPAHWLLTAVNSSIGVFVDSVWALVFVYNLSELHLKPITFSVWLQSFVHYRKLTQLSNTYFQTFRNQHNFVFIPKEREKSLQSTDLSCEIFEKYSWHELVRCWQQVVMRSELISTWTNLSFLMALGISTGSHRAVLFFS